MTGAYITRLQRALRSLGFVTKRKRRVTVPRQRERELPLASALPRIQQRIRESARRETPLPIEGEIRDPHRETNPAK